MTPKRFEVPMLLDNPALKIVLADFKKRLAPKPKILESAYECGSYTTHYRYHFDPDELAREIVVEVTCYTDKEGKQVSFSELQDKGWTVPDALLLQEWLDDTAWEARNES